MNRRTCGEPLCDAQTRCAIGGADAEVAICGAAREESLAAAELIATAASGSRSRRAEGDDQIFLGEPSRWP